MLANKSPSGSGSLKLQRGETASALQLTPDKLLQGLSAAPILQNPVSCITISEAGPCTAAKVRVSRNCCVVNKFSTEPESGFPVDASPAIAIARAY